MSLNVRKIHLLIPYLANIFLLLTSNFLPSTNFYLYTMPFFTKSNLEDLRKEAEQLSICVEHFLYASEHIPESDWKTKGFYDNCIEKCNGRLKAIHFLMESIRRGRPVTEDELEEARELEDEKLSKLKKDAK